MRVFILPQPTQFERKLKRLLKSPPSARADWRVFANGELFVTVSGVGRDVCVIGRSEPPAENVLATLLLVDTLKRNGARRITLAIPYFGYSRHDRAVVEGDSVAAAALLQAFAAAGVTRFVSVDLHGKRHEGYSPLPIARVDPIPLMAKRLRGILRGKRFTVVSPDRGAIDRARRFAELTGAGAMAWVDKKRLRKGGVVARGLLGETEGHVALIVDDQVDTGGTVIAAVQVLRSQGFKEFHLCATHPVLSKGARAKLERIGFKTIMFSDTVARTGEEDLPKGAIVVSTAAEIARAID